MSGKLSGPDVKALAWAVVKAEGWRNDVAYACGSVLVMQECDKQIAKAQAALKKLRALVRCECDCKVCRAERKAEAQRVGHE